MLKYKMEYNLSKQTKQTQIIAFCRTRFLMIHLNSNKENKCSEKLWKELSSNFNKDYFSLIVWFDFNTFS